MPGLFNQTLVPFLQRHASATSKIGFVNMDMDLYSGARYVLESIIPHLSRGAVIHFHDFYNAMNSCNSDEMRALYDVLFAQSQFGWTQETSLQLQYMPFETTGFREPITFRVV